MELSNVENLPLGRIFGFLTKQYIGIFAKRMKNTPVERYYFALMIIGQNSGKISQQQLADQLLIDKVHMVRMLDCLSKDGFIERMVNPDDRRQHLLFITEKGLPWVKEVEKAQKETEEVFLSFLEPDDRQRFLQDLKKLCVSVSDLPAEEIELFYNRIKDSNYDQTN